MSKPEAERAETERPGREGPGRAGPGRRTVLLAAVALGVAPPVHAQSAEEEVDPAGALPRENDRFVFAFGSRKGEVITPEHLELGARPLVAYPADPASGVVRSGSRLNQVMLVRLAPEDLSEETRARAVDGIVAYSGVCTHTGCDVADWMSEERLFHCPCHDSVFDPSDSARVVSGEALRRLPALPLKLVDGSLAAAGAFDSRVGGDLQP